MKIRIRDARTDERGASQDLGLFKRLLKSFLEDEDNSEALTGANPDTVASFEDLWLTSTLALLVADKAFALVMSIENGASFKLGKLGQIWIYVLPDARDNGIEEALYAEVKERMLDLGFGGLTTSIPASNEQAWKEAEVAGFKPFMVAHVLELK